MVRLFFCLPQTWWIRIFAVRTLSRKDLPSDILKKEKSVFRLKRSAKDCEMADWFFVRKVLRGGKSRKKARRDF